MKKADTLKHKKWLKDRKRDNKIRKQHNYETKTLKGKRFSIKDEKEVIPTK